MEALPVPYNRNNPEDVASYLDFIKTYGSHYTDNVVLGGKRIYSTKMSTQSLTELTRDSVDVASTMSLDIQVR